MLSSPEYRSKIFVPSLANSLFLVLFLTLALSRGAFLLSDADTGWHIRAGEFMWDTFSILRHDIFSSATPPPSWMNHQWLSEVVMALVHKSFGLTGIVIFFALLISLAYSMLFKLLQKERGNILIVVFTILLTIASSVFHWLARPHIFSLLFLVISCSLLEAFQYRHRNYLYVSPFLMLFWTNMHGGFISGFILIFIYLLGNLIKFIACRDEAKAFYKQKTKVLTLTMVACLLASLINPYGINTLTYPIQLISDEFVMNHISEFQSPNFHNPLLLPFECYLLFMILLIGISKKNLNVIEILLVVAFTHMALYSQRFIPLFCIVIAPLLVRQTDWILNQIGNRFVDVFQKKSNDIRSLDASTRGYLWFFVGILVMVTGVLTNRIEYKFDENEKPVAAVNVLKRVPIKGNMFNDDAFGGYLIYSAFPQYKVFIDSRVDMYGVDRLKDYLNLVYFKPGWEDVVEKYHINWVIFNADSILSRYLMERNDWKLVYSDKVATIFVRNILENQDILKRYGDLKTVLREKR